MAKIAMKDESPLNGITPVNTWIDVKCQRVKVLHIVDRL